MEVDTGNLHGSSLDTRTAAVPTQGPRFLSFRGLRRRNKVNDDVSKLQQKGPLGLTTLWNPSEACIADIIFVHGLNGGSQSTWSCNGDTSTFWPQEWLPTDGAFQDVRIHSFGYNSSWSRESILNIEDFAQALLVSIKDSPTIPVGDSVRCSSSDQISEN